MNTISEALIKARIWDPDEEAKKRATQDPNNILLMNLGNSLRFFVRNSSDYHIIHIATWGCNYTCKSCLTKMCHPKEYYDFRKIKIASEEVVNRLGFYKDWKGNRPLFYFTGGEPFLQYEAIINIAERLQDIGICFAATNGSLIPRTSRLNVFKRIYIIPYYHSNLLHIEYTGQPLYPVVQNYKWLVDNFEGEIILRLVLFPYYQKAENIKAWCEFWKEQANTDKVSVQIKGLWTVNAYGDKVRLEKGHDDFARGIAAQYFDTQPTFNETKARVSVPFRGHFDGKEEVSHMEVVKCVSRISR